MKNSPPSISFRWSPRHRFTCNGWTAKTVAQRRSATDGGHPPKHEKQQKGRGGVQQHVVQVVPPTDAGQTVAIHHVGNGSQRAPTLGMEFGEGPRDALCRSPAVTCGLRYTLSWSSQLTKSKWSVCANTVSSPPTGRQQPPSANGALRGLAGVAGWPLLGRAEAAGIVTARLQLLY